MNGYTNCARVYFNSCLGGTADLMFDNETAMWYNNTLDEVKKQVNFCGTLNFGIQYYDNSNLQSLNTSIITYHNPTFAFINKLYVKIVDCHNGFIPEEDYFG